MNRRDFLKATLAGGSTLACPFLLAEARDESVNRPNIVLIMADDLGLALTPENHNEEGLIQTLSIRASIYLASMNRIAHRGWITAGREKAVVDRFLPALGIKAGNGELPVSSLSGGNSEAARLNGINVNRVKIQVMGIVAFLAALSGVMQSAEIMSGTATTARGWELDVISAVIIGGTSLMGGVVAIRGTLIGIIFLGILVNGMTLLNINEYWQHVIRGVLILSAVLINRAQAKQR